MNVFKVREGAREPGDCSHRLSENIQTHLKKSTGHQVNWQPFCCDPNAPVQVVIYMMDAIISHVKQQWPTI